MAIIKIGRDLYKGQNEYGIAYAARQGSGWVRFLQIGDTYHVATDDMEYKTTKLEDAARYASHFGSKRSRTIKAALADYI
jgi:hypothetical protein